VLLVVDVAVRLNVVVRSPPLYPSGGPKWRDNYPEWFVRPSGRPPIVWNHCFIFSCCHPLTGRSWTVTLLFLYYRTLIYSPPLTRLLMLLLLLASGNATLTPVPPLFSQQIRYIPAPEKLGEPQSDAAAARGGSTPPAPGSLGPLSGPCFSGVTWVIGSAHLIQQTYPTKLQAL